jgi:hypothetical protein
MYVTEYLGKLPNYVHVTECVGATALLSHDIIPSCDIPIYFHVMAYLCATDVLACTSLDTLMKESNLVHVTGYFGVTDLRT